MRKFLFTSLLLLLSVTGFAGQINYGDLSITGSLSITTVATASEQLSVLFQDTTGEIKQFDIPSLTAPTFIGTVTAPSFIGDGSGLTGVSSVSELDDLTNVDAITNLATASAISFINGEWKVNNIFRSIDSMSGMSEFQHSLSVNVTGGNVYLEVEKTGTGNMIYYLINTASGLVNRYELDCTTGSGTSGKARIILTEGSATSPQTNYAYITVASDPVTYGGLGVATLNASTSLPSGNFAWVGKGAIGDDTFQTSDGAWVFQRYDDATVRSTRGETSIHREKTRSNGATYNSGAVLTITEDAAATPDSFTISTSSGLISQMNMQTWPAMIDPSDFYVANDPTTPFEKLNDLYDVDEDTAGGTLRGKRYNLVLWGSVGSGTANKLFINVPRKTYTNNSQAINDRDNSAVTTVPNAFRQTAFLIARITLRHKTISGGTLQLLNLEDLRGTPLGSRSSGSSGAATEFEDTNFMIFDGVDVTKQFKFQADGIGTGTVRELTVQDTDGIIALTDVAQTFTAPQTFTNLTDTATITAVAYEGYGGNLTGISSGGASALGDLTDVNLTSTATNDLLNFNGTNWVNTNSPTFSSFTFGGETLDTLATSLGSGADTTLPTLGYLDDFLFPLTGGTITGSTTISNTLGVTGAVTLSSALAVTGNTVLGDTTVGDLSITTTLSIPNALTSTATSNRIVVLNDDGEVVTIEGVIHTGNLGSYSYTGNGVTGAGSTGAYTLRVTNTITETGTDVMVYTSDAVNGDYWTVKKNAIVTAMWNVHEVAAAVGVDGWTVNGDATVAIHLQSTSVVLSMSEPHGSYVSKIMSSFTKELKVGDIIRAQWGVTYTTGTNQRFSITAIPSARVIITPITQTCYISEEQTSGTAGGGITDSTWVTRTLNTTENSCSFVTLSSNEFTLTPGEYDIEVFTPAFEVNAHKARLYDVTNSSVEKYGSSEYSGGSTQTASRIFKYLNITSSTTYKVEHQVTSSKATNGLGNSTGLGTEIFTQVKITKLK